jgi:hypothetical protein
VPAALGLDPESLLLEGVVPGAPAELDEDLRRELRLLGYSD